MIEFIKNLFGSRTFGAIRSARWSEVRNRFLATHSKCEVCDTKGNLLNQLNCHHCTPFHVDPTLELNPNNLITLCRVHHFLFGHLMSWKSWNVDVRKDALDWSIKIKKRP